MSSRLRLGAPGIYRVPAITTQSLAGEPLDVCAFVGVAPRGPVRVPVVDENWRDDAPTVGPDRPRRRSVAVPVGSFTEYERLFGGLEGPGRLPWAVRAYFEQGGQRAWIIRIVHDYPDAAGDAGGVASLELDDVTATIGTFELLARNEGAWANTLEANFGFATEPLAFEALGATEIGFEFGDAPPTGTLLRLDFGGTPALRFITDYFVEGRVDGPGRVARAILSAPLPGIPDEAEIVTAELWLDDRDGRTERHGGLGLSALHPRWIATVLCHESELAWPAESWIDGDLVPVDVSLPELDPKVDPTTGTSQWRRFDGGEDRYADLTTSDFFDPGWDPLAGEPGSGLAALADAPEVASVVVPDLYHPEAFIAQEPVLDEDDDLGSADFQTCLELEPTGEEQEPIRNDLPGLQLDPRVPADLEIIVGLQQAVCAQCEQLAIVGLLDVPPGLRQQQILAWRQQFSSSWCAAYHPWLRMAPNAEEPDREILLRLGPSAVAAGIIARKELTYGVPYGPANELCAGVVDVEDRVSPKRHDRLHQRHVNVCLRERDGVRLTAARTLSRDPSLRQLSVRRLMQLLHRTLARQTQWIVFEPNGPQLRERVRGQVRNLLRSLYRQGAFRGASEQEAFFIVCDRTNNPRHLGDRGQLVCDVGVAPAEPLEFLVLRITHDGDGNLGIVS